MWAGYLRCAVPPCGNPLRVVLLHGGEYHLASLPNQSITDIMLSLADSRKSKSKLVISRLVLLCDRLPT